MAIILCSIENCEKPHKAKTYCAMHYRRLLVNGDVHRVQAIRSSKGASLEERFWAKVSKDPEHPKGCWEWLGSKTHEGYGRFRIGDKGKGAHRVSYMWHIGEISEGHEVDHKCHNPSCVRPDHLRLLTQMQNSQNREGANVNSKSGIRGLVWYPQTRRWLASYGFENKRYKKYFSLEDKAKAIEWLESNRGTHSPLVLD